MLSNSLKLVFARNIISPHLTLARNCTSKLDPYADWKRPEKISCILPEKSGDLKPFEAPLEDLPKDIFIKNSKEYADADEIVKKIFSFRLNPRTDIVKQVRKDTIEKIHRHELDYGSMEVRVAYMTVQIRAMQQAIVKEHKNKKLKVALKEMIEKRRRFLTYIRKWDYKKFEWLLERLDLVYKPGPETYHRIERKASILKLTDIYTERIRQEKLDAYRKELESKQLDFLDKKVKTLEFIRNEQIECKVKVTITPEQIQAAKKQYKELKEKKEIEAEIQKKQSVKEDYELNL